MLQRILTMAFLASPLFIYTGLPYPHAFPRFIALACLSAISLIALFFLAKKTAVEFSLNKIDYAIIAYIGILVITTALGTSVTEGFWSTLERSTGVAFWVIWGAMILFLKHIFSSENQTKLAFQAHAVVGALMALWGIAEKIIPGFSLSFSVDRISATLGNPIFFGMYLVLSLGLLALGYAQNRKLFGTHTPYILTAIAICQISALLLTRSRGPLLGLIAGCLVAYIFYTIYYAQHRIRNFVLVITSICIAGVLLFASGTILLTSTTAESRIINWRMAWNAAQERPILGWGWENYRFATQNHFDPTLTRFGFNETYSDKPHNAQLELLVASGVIGLASYIILIGLVCYAIITLYRSEKISLVTLCMLFGLVVAHEVQNFTAFETHGSLVLWGVLLAWLSARYQKILFPARPKKILYATAGLLSIIIAVKILTTIPAALAITKITRITSTDYQEKSVLSKKLDPQNSIYAFEEWQTATENFIDPVWQHPELLSQLSEPQLTALQNEIGHIVAVTQTKENAHIENAWWQLNAGKTWFKLYYLTNDPDFSRKAIVALNTTHALQPTRQEPLILLGQLELRLTQPTEALVYFDKAVKADELYYVARGYRGLTYLILKNPQAAWPDMRYALEHNFSADHPGILPVIQKEFIAAGMHSEAQEAERLVKKVN